MISPAYYQPDNLVQLYQGGKVRHFLFKPRTVTVEDRPVTLSYGETIFSKTAEIFGEENESLWSVVADNQPLKHPDDWQAGETMRLPVIVLNDYTPTRTQYATQSTTTTPV